MSQLQPSQLSPGLSAKAKPYCPPAKSFAAGGVSRPSKEKKERAGPRTRRRRRRDANPTLPPSGLTSSSGRTDERQNPRWVKVRSRAGNSGPWFGLCEDKWLAQVIEGRGEGIPSRDEKLRLTLLHRNSSSLSPPLTPSGHLLPAKLLSPTVSLDIPRPPRAGTRDGGSDGNNLNHSHCNHSDGCISLLLDLEHSPESNHHLRKYSPESEPGLQDSFLCSWGVERGVLNGGGHSGVHSNGVSTVVGGEEMFVGEGVAG
ncbi:unnamed protein product, partial [Choristocarpus tenellus]